MYGSLSWRPTKATLSWCRYWGISWREFRVRVWICSASVRWQAALITGCSAAVTRSFLKEMLSSPVMVLSNAIIIFDYNAHHTYGVCNEARCCIWVCVLMTSWILPLKNCLVEKNYLTESRSRKFLSRSRYPIHLQIQRLPLRPSHRQFGWTYPYLHCFGTSRLDLELIRFGNRSYHR